MSRFVTAEAVCVGHPDKLCDLIADTITDAALAANPASHTSIEVMATGRQILVAGELACEQTLPIRELTRKALTRAGYDPKSFKINVLVVPQSSDIASGVGLSWEWRMGATCQADPYGYMGAGDQGTVYGYATHETRQRLPLAQVLASEICRHLDQARTEGAITGIHSDGKAQVTLNYDTEDKPSVGWSCRSLRCASMRR